MQGFRRYFLSLLSVSVWAGLGQAVSPPSRAGLGEKVADVAFADAAGKTSALYDRKDAKAIVVVFLSFDCPVSNSYAQPLAELSKTYGPKGVSFVGVVASEDVDAAQLAKQVKEFKIPFPVYRDPQRKAVAAFHAEVTPHAFLLDGGFVMRYRGRIDDSFAARLKKKNDTTRFDLRVALDELLSGKAVSEPTTAPIGCPIVLRNTAPIRAGKATYYRDVLPILQNRCQQCHRPGEVGPFSLMTYKQAVNWSDDIKKYTQNRAMPPWKPVAGVPFHDERRMTEQEIATLAAWVDANVPAGDIKDAPPPRRFADGWQLGNPDLVLTPTDDFHVGAAGSDLFRCYVLPTNLPEDKHVIAIEVRPGNRRVVHHALLFVDSNAAARKLEDQEKQRKKADTEKDRGPGYTSRMGIGIRPTGGMGGWAPGQLARRLPANTGYFLPKGADVVAQIHYHRNGRDEDDRTRIGLYFAPKPVDHRLLSIVIPGRFLFIPAGNERYTVRNSVTVQQDCAIHSVMPHMHMLGKEVTVTLTPPEGKPQTLVAIKDWDYNWQETYFFRDTIQVKSGTRLDIEGVFDNSAKNPNNPFKPPRVVWMGEQTTNEMLFGFIGATSDTPGRIRVRVGWDDARKPASGK